VNGSGAKEEKARGESGAGKGSVEEKKLFHSTRVAREGVLAGNGDRRFWGGGKGRVSLDPGKKVGGGF